MEVDLQLLWAGLIVERPTSLLLAAGVLGSGLTAASWLVSRISGIPLALEADILQPIDLLANRDSTHQHGSQRSPTQSHSDELTAHDGELAHDRIASVDHAAAHRHAAEQAHSNAAHSEVAGSITPDQDHAIQQ